MVTPANTDRVMQFYCSSGDTKPLVYNGITLAQGSTIIEIDTDKIYLLKYNNDTQEMEWKEWA